MKVEATMEAGAVSERSRGAVRCGRPPRGHAGQVEERILDAAGQVFLEHGFQGASVDEIAEVACAGKPTIYARFPNKHALFTAVIERLVSRHTSLDPLSCPARRSSSGSTPLPPSF
jgi:AcrR family transcriptional regulator